MPSDARKESTTAEEQEQLLHEKQQGLKIATEEQEAARIRRKKQADSLLATGVIIKWLLRVSSIATNILKILRDTLAVLLDILQPLKAVVAGFFVMIELAEAIFLSKETMNRRTVKIASSIVVASLTTASAILVLNPLTAPIGTALSAAAMAAAALRDLFLWYKAEKDLQKAITAKSQYEYDVATGNKKASDAELQTLEYKIALCTKHRDEKRRSFAYNAISCLGMTILALASFALAGFILANPIALGVVGLVLFACAVAGGAYNVYKKYSTPVPQPPAPAVLKVAKVVDVIVHAPALSLTKSLDHVADTQHVLTDLAKGETHATMESAEDVGKVRKLLAKQLSAITTPEPSNIFDAEPEKKFPAVKIAADPSLIPASKTNKPGD